MSTTHRKSTKDKVKENVKSSDTKKIIENTRSRRVDNSSRSSFRAVVFGLVLLFSVSLPFSGIFRKEQTKIDVESPQGFKVAIFGGTGNQGGSAIKYLISEGKISESNIRVLTRNSTSKSSKDLLSQHPSLVLVEGDSNDPNALDRLFDGVEAVFAITFSTLNPQIEFDTGVLIGRSLSKHRSISTFVFSGGMRTGIQGLDIKADIEDHLIQTLADSIPCQVYLHTSFFYENLVLKGPSLRVSRDTSSSPSSSPSFVFRTPLPSHLSVPMVSSEDIGRVAAYIICSSSQSPLRTWCSMQSYSARVHTIPLIGDTVSGPAFASEFSRLSGLSARYESIPLEAMKGLDPKDLQRLQNMYDWYSSGDGATRGLEGIETTRTIFPSGLIRSLSTWMQEVGEDWIQHLLRREHLL